MAFPAPEGTSKNGHSKNTSPKNNYAEIMDNGAGSNAQQHKKKVRGSNAADIQPAPEVEDDDAPYPE